MLKLYVGLAMLAFGANFIVKNLNEHGFSQNIVKAMEDEIPKISVSKLDKPNKSDSGKSDSRNKIIRYCVARMPSLTSREKYEYFYVDLNAFREESKYKENTVTLKALKGSPGGWYGYNSLNYADFEEVKKEYFNKKEDDEFSPILKKIYELESSEGEITKYNKFIDDLPCTYVINEDGYKEKAYDFSNNSSKNEELYKNLVDLVDKHLVPLGRELIKCISSKFEKEANEIKESYAYLRCIPFNKEKNERDTEFYIHTDEEMKYLNAMHIAYEAKEHLTNLLNTCMFGAYAWLGKFVSLQRI